LTCKRHPSYRAEYPPKWDCRLCEGFWQERQGDLARAKVDLNLNLNKAQVRALQKKVIELEAAQDFYSQLHHIPKIEVNRSKPKTGKRPTTPIAFASDWHVGEVVSFEETIGRNQYDIKEAQRRAANYWDNILWLRNSWQKAETCEDQVLALNGDMVSGNIHPELLETNEVGLVEQVEYCVGMLLPGIEALSKVSRRLIVTCTNGNHGRITAKSQIKTGWSNSLESLLYRWLRAECKHLENIEWHIPKAEGLALDIMGKRLQIQHGTQIKSQGGIGGILVPLTRWATRAASADYYGFGHFHQAECYGKIIVNGSLIGDSAYSKWLGLEYREPEQVAFVIDEKRGLRHFERVSVK
jgi:hypothetical protein